MGIGMRVGDSGTSFVLGELPRQAFPLHAAGTSAAMANRMPHVHRFPAAWCVAQALQNSATGRAPLLAAPHRQASASMTFRVLFPHSSKSPVPQAGVNRPPGPGKFPCSLAMIPCSLAKSLLSPAIFPGSLSKFPCFVRGGRGSAWMFPHGLSILPQGIWKGPRWLIRCQLLHFPQGRTTSRAFRTLKMPVFSIKPVLRSPDSPAG